MPDLEICRPYISKKIPCARHTAFASGYQAQNIGAHDARCFLWLVATLSCTRCVRRDHCHTLLHLDASSDTTFPLVLPDAAHNTITPPDSPLILSAPLLPHGLSAISHILKGGTLDTSDGVVRKPAAPLSHSLNHNIALIISAKFYFQNFIFQRAKMPAHSSLKVSNT